MVSRRKFTRTHAEKLPHVPGQRGGSIDDRLDKLRRLERDCVKYRCPTPARVVLTLVRLNPATGEPFPGQDEPFQVRVCSRHYKTYDNSAYDITAEVELPPLPD